MNITEFLNIHRHKGIEFKLSSEGKLLCDAPKGAMTDELKELIQKKKDEIISFLQQATIDRWATIVPIQPKGSKFPFFCFHGAGGNVLNYSVLIEYLGYDQPLYGLQSIGLDGITPPLQCIEDMASRYLTEIRRIQPHGPYHFGGGSMGGMIALEAAQQLQQDGETIGILVMFDTLGPNHSITKSGRLLHRVKQNTIGDILKYGINKVSERQENKKKMETCLAYQKRGEPIPLELRVWFVEKMNYAAMDNYEFSIFDGEITLLKGSDEEGGLWSDPQRGWEGMTTKGLKIYEIPGHHDTLVEEPLLGKQLSRCLEECYHEQ